MTTARALAFLLVAASAGACGKSGPPLPPLVRLPTPPAELAAARRGDSVDVRLLVPSANTDGTRPANLQRVEVYAYTGPANLTDDQIARLGTRVGSVEVKAPRDPSATVDPDEPVGDVPAPEGPGLDQGASAVVREALGSSTTTPVELPRAGRANVRDAGGVPLAGPPPTPLTRFYAGVGITTRGRRGPFSTRAGVPLVPPPPPVAAPEVTYDETIVRVTWTPVATPTVAPDAGSTDLLPSRPIGLSPPSQAYNVYQVSSLSAVSPQPSALSSQPATLERSETLLTKTPIEEPRFDDPRIEWGAERCYAVRVARTLAGLTVESDLSPAFCRTLADTFPPKAPVGLTTISSEGSVNLIWDANDEKDLAGYLVLRRDAEPGTLTPVTPSPIQVPNFIDKVPSGVRFFYAIQAVDRAGNVSAASEPMEETAR